MRELKIDPELRDLLPPLTDEEFKQLEKNIVENGFDKNFPIMEWNGFIVDGHNRYKICQKHNITDYVIGTLGYETKDQVMEWMLDIQLGRRNLSPIQRIAIAEKYRSIYEKQARERQGTRNDLLNNFPQNFGESCRKKLSKDREVNSRLAKVANVNPETYRQAKRVLDSDNDDLKKRVLSGEIAISTGYKELVGKKENKKAEDDNENIPTTTQPLILTPSKPHISDEIKQICADLKTEKTKEYLDSIWDYKVSIIERMNDDFEMYYDTFSSTLMDMDGRVTQEELSECIKNAEENIEKLLEVLEQTKKYNLKGEN